MNRFSKKSEVSYKIITIFIGLLFLFNSATSQKKDSTAGFRDIFSDLPFDDPVGNSSIGKSENVFEKISNNIFVRPSLSKKRCVVGEPVLLTVILLTRLNSTSALTKQPYLPDFFTTALPVDESTPVSVRENGKNYRLFKVLEWQLVPTHPGILKIDRIRMDHKVVYKDAQGKELFYRGKTETDSVNLLVDSIPPKGKPLGYTGLVGKFSLSVFPQYNNLPVGKSNILQIEIEGIGNYAQLMAPAIEWPQGIEAFTVKEKTEMINDSFPTKARKTFEIPFIAHKEGPMPLPAISINYFDPFLKKFAVADSKEIVLTVLKEEPNIVHQPVTVAHTLKEREWKRWIIFLSLGLLFIGFLIILVRRKQEKRKAEKERLKVQQIAVEEKKSQVQQVETHFEQELGRLRQQNETRNFILEYKNLITGYLQAKTGTLASTEEEIVKKIKSRDDSLADHIWDIYRNCNTLLYSAQYLSPVEREQMIEDLADVHKRVSGIWI